MLDVLIDGDHLQGSPFALSVITLRPDAAQCVVRGEGLKDAISRKPQKFEVEFVDSRGHPSNAEDLDVYVTWAGGDAASAPPPAQLSSAEKEARAAVSAYASRIQSPSAEAVASTTVRGGAAAASTLAAAEGGAALPSETAEDEGAAAFVTAPDSPPSASASPIETDTSGSFAGATTAESAAVSGAAASASDGALAAYRPLDAFARQRFEQLWASRASADKWFVKRAAEKTAKKKQFTLVPR